MTSCLVDRLRRSAHTPLTDPQYLSAVDRLTGVIARCCPRTRELLPVLLYTAEFAEDDFDYMAVS